MPPCTSFSVFKRANRPCYLVAFKNEKTGTCLPPISTRQTSEDAAIKTAYEWFRNGVPQKDKAVDLKEYTLRDLAKDANSANVEFIVNELKRRGLLKLDVKRIRVWQSKAGFYGFFLGFIGM